MANREPEPVTFHKPGLAVDVFIPCHVENGPVEGYSALEPGAGFDPLAGPVQVIVGGPRGGQGNCWRIRKTV